jgi:ATP-dependent DNA helicase DinG
MAIAVARTFEDSGVLLVEAGTGTGKTLAYLVPAILSRRRVLISTGTKNLQEQIFQKDLPILRRTLDLSFSATCMKGRANYLCLHRFEALKSARQTGLASPAAMVFLPAIERWAASTDTGDRAEIDDLPEDLPFWNEISASVETCLGTECPRYDECFVTRMRRRAADSDLVVVNHHLLCADAAVRQNAYGEVIPECQYAVVDEAHQLEDVATQHFGVAASNHRVDELIRDGERLAALGSVGAGSNALGLALVRVKDRAGRFFASLGRQLPATARDVENRLRMKPGMFEAAGEDAASLEGALDTLEATAALTKDPASLDLSSLARRAGELRDQLRFLRKAGDPDYAYFVEWRGRSIFLRACPIDVSSVVREVLFDRMAATVLTSATLTVEGSFEYIRGRLGAIRSPAGRTLRLPSEFDYARQTLLYLPRRMPDPRSPEFATACAREIVDILKRTEGRAFVLFTSYAALRAVEPSVADELAYPVFVQGDAPRSTLLQQFRRTPHAILLATSSFWQGVDVMGDALSCVIIDKLPFASPGDPVTAARIEAITERGGHPFDEYQVPVAILALLQGLGRLIRHRDDRGVLAILDPRLQTMGYGRRFMASLPPAKLTRDADDISRFLEQPRTS